jgi:hypothetical protein
MDYDRCDKEWDGKEILAKEGQEIKVRKGYKRKYEANNPLEFQRTFTTVRIFILIEFPLSFLV